MNKDNLSFDKEEVLDTISSVLLNSIFCDAAVEKLISNSLKDIGEADIETLIESPCFGSKRNLISHLKRMISDCYVADKWEETPSGKTKSLQCRAESTTLKPELIEEAREALNYLQFRYKRLNRLYQIINKN